jgi:rare lipoprotein A
VWLAVAMLALVVIAGCATTGGPPPMGSHAEARGDRLPQVGVASFYARRFHGRTTASGRAHDNRSLTAAHRTLPFGTRVRVTHLGNRRSVVVTVVDRGPFVRGRIIDLSRRAARELGILRAGIARVRIERVR